MQSVSFCFYRSVVSFQHWLHSHNPVILGSKRHNLEIMDRNVVSMSRGAFFYLSLYYRKKNNQSILLFKEIYVSYIVPMNFISEINYFLSCILYTRKLQPKQQ